EPEAPVEVRQSPPTADVNLADMAQRLEAALRRPPRPAGDAGPRPDLRQRPGAETARPTPPAREAAPPPSPAPANDAAPEPPAAGRAGGGGGAGGAEAARAGGKSEPRAGQAGVQHPGRRDGDPARRTRRQAAQPAIGKRMRGPLLRLSLATVLIAAAAH